MRFTVLACSLAVLGLLQAAEQGSVRAERRLFLPRAAAAAVPRAVAEPHAGSAAATEVEAEGAAQPDGTWELLVLGADARPVAGVAVGDAKTDGEGRVRLPAPADGASLAVNVADRPYTLRSPFTVLRIDDLYPVVPLPIDGATARPLPGARVTVTPSHVRARAAADLRLDIAAPAGYVSTRASLNAEAGPLARALRAVVAVRPEVPLRVRVLDAGGHPVAGAEITRAWLAGAEAVFEAVSEDAEVEYEIDEEIWGPDFPLSLAAVPSGADGWLDVRGVPWLQGERVRLVVAAGRRQAATSLMLLSHPAPRELAVRLPAAINVPAYANSCICLGGGCGSGMRRKARVGHGVLVARVTTRDGRPAPGVCVDLCGPVSRWALADADGSVRFGKLPAGAYTLRTESVGFTCAETEVELRAGELRTLDLVEPTGWTARLQVVDADGVAVPGAGFTAQQAHSVAYLPCTDGVQDLALFTNAAGEAVLEHVSPGPLKVRVAYGSRSAEATLDPGSSPALIRLPPPD